MSASATGASRPRVVVAMTQIAEWAAWLGAVYIAYYTIHYAYTTGISVVIADSWSFTEGFVKNYNNHSLGLSDFFGKRTLGYDHAQPIQRAVLWFHMYFFHMDFGVEGAIGGLFALGLACFISREVRLALVHTGSPKRVTAAILIVAVFGAIFSQCSRGVFEWSLVTLIFADILGAVLLAAYAHTCLLRDNPVRLFFATLIGCALMDTLGVMIVVGLLILFLINAWHSRNWRKIAPTFAAVIVAVLAYKGLYSLIFMRGSLGTDDIVAPLGNLLRDRDQAWKLFVAPLGGALVSTSRLVDLAFSNSQAWAITGFASAVMLLATVWFWATYFRQPDKRLPFIAAAIMLLCYGSIAGVLIVRVPEYGFDYFIQPRYTLFYLLQLVALLMLGAHQVATGQVRRWGHSAVCASGLAVIALWISYAALTTRDAPYVRDYNQQMANQIHALWLDPTSTPTVCSTNIPPCQWTVARRIESIAILSTGQWNVFSPKFRKRHRIHWEESPQPEARQ